MKSEAAKGLVRISSNYVRLGINLVMGLIFLPFMLSWLGNEPVGLIGLLGASTGVGAMFMTVSRAVMIWPLVATPASRAARFTASPNTSPSRSTTGP